MNLNNLDTQEQALVSLYMELAENVTKILLNKNQTVLFV